MSTTPAHEATRSYFCKTPDCGNEASSPVGRYAYCKLHQEQNAKSKPSPKPADEDTHAGRIRLALAAATRLDRAEAKARDAAHELAAARTAHKNAIIAMTAPHGVRHEGDA